MTGDDHKRSKEALSVMNRFFVEYKQEHDNLITQNDSLIARNQELERLLKEAEEKNNQVRDAGAAITILEEERRTLESSLCEANAEKTQLKQVNKEIEAKNKELINSIDEINQTFHAQFKDFRTVSTPAPTERHNVLANQTQSESQNTCESSNFTESVTADTAAISTKIPTRPKKKLPRKRRPSSWDSDDDTDISENDVSIKSYYEVKPSLEKCKLCESENGLTKTFKHRTALFDHLTQVHPNSVAPFYFRCRFFGTGCSKYYSTERGLLNHIRVVHPDGKVLKSPKTPKTPKSTPLTCSICNVESFSQRLFEKHMKKFHAGTPEAAELIENSTYLKIPAPSTNYGKTSSRRILVNNQTEHKNPSSNEISPQPNDTLSNIVASCPSAPPDSSFLDSTIIPTLNLPEINQEVLQSIKKETLLDDPLHCCCGFSSSDGNAIATHLMDCDQNQKIVYSNAETAAQQYALMKNTVQESYNNRSERNIHEMYLNDNNDNQSNICFNPALTILNLNSNHFVPKHIQQNIGNVDNAEIEYEIVEISDDE